jgi:hypothetical protein
MSPWCEPYTVFDSNIHYYLQLIKTALRQWIRLELLSTFTSWPRPFNRLHILTENRKLDFQFSQTVQPTAHSHREPQAGLPVQPRPFNRQHILPGTTSWTCSSEKTVQPAAHSHREPQAGLAVQPRPFNQQHILSGNRKLDLQFSQNVQQVAHSPRNHKLDLQFNQDSSTSSTFSPGTASWTYCSMEDTHSVH